MSIEVIFNYPIKYLSSCMVVGFTITCAITIYTYDHTITRQSLIQLYAFVYFSFMDIHLDPDGSIPVEEFLQATKSLQCII
jgi:hypothetical protein